MSDEPAPTNPVLSLIEQRTSTRTFAPVPITDDEKAAILHAAMRAPTAGNLMLYSIVEVTDQAVKDELARTCDDQPFIAQAPWVLVFLADYQKWLDLFAFSGTPLPDGAARVRPPGLGDLVLACCDALIAAQTAVIAAESLGIGSCYVGDILENAERHIELLDLPPHTFPVTMLVFGRPAKRRPPTPRYEKHVVHRDRYRRLTPPELAEVLDDLAALHAPHGLPEGAADYAQVVYRRKYMAAFTHEMNRSVALLVERWQKGEPS